MKSKRLFYVPGLISLIFLPVLLFIWGPPDRKDVRLVKLNLSALNKNNAWDKLRFTDAYVCSTIRKKKKIALKIQDLHWDLSSISYSSDYNNIDTSLRSFYLKHDTFSIIDISLGAQNSYTDFVWLCNQMMIHDIRRYAFLDNHFYVFANPRPVPHNNMALYFDAPVTRVPKYIKPTRWESFKEEWNQQYYLLTLWVRFYFEDQKQNRQLAIGFILLIAIPTIIKISRSRKKRIFLLYKQHSRISKSFNT